MDGYKRGGLSIYLCQKAHSPDLFQTKYYVYMFITLIIRDIYICVAYKQQLDFPRHQGCGSSLRMLPLATNFFFSKTQMVKHWPPVTTMFLIWRSESVKLFVRGILEQIRR